MDEVDVAIVGAGIAGASLAFHLAPHARVALLEAEDQPGMHSTGRSAAMFMESYGSPQGRALTRASRAFYESPPPGFAGVPLLAPRGVLYAAWEGQAGDLARHERELAAAGTAIERLDAAAALARVPVLRAEGLIGALLEPDAMDVDVHALHQGYLRAARARGAVLHVASALQRGVRDGNGWTLATARGGTLRAAVVVDAAGAWADAVASRCGVPPLGVQPRRRSAFTFDAPADVDARAWPAVVAVDEGWYFKPDAGQLLGSPANADPVPPHDVVAEELDIATGIDGITRHTTLAIRRPRHTWAGLRSFMPDGELLIGFDPRADGFFWLAGQGGWGIQSADGAAQLASAAIGGRPLPPALSTHGVDAAACAPDRLVR